MSDSTRPHRASLAVYLSSPTVSVSLPSLPSTDLQHALNAQKYTPGNNDVLEFLGDRVVNLACALMASKFSHSPDQQTLFARKLSNNDTLGRIAHQLRLPQHTSVRLDSADRRAADAWSRSRSGSPPKLFADLFESYMGALFLRHGWHYSHAWLKKVYEPIVAAADRDAFSTTEVAPSLWHVPDAQPWPQQTQWAFEDFIDERKAEMQEAIKAVIQSLPRPEVSSGRKEVGMQLLKLWICELAFRVYPEMHSARDRGAHFLSCITRALMSDDTLGHLGLRLSLSSYLPPSDPDFLVAYPLFGSNQEKDVIEDLDRAKPKVAGILKALTGAFYLRHPTRARKWGHKWLKPLVCWTMNTLLRIDRHRPIIGRSLPASPEPTVPAKDKTSKSATAVEDLLSTFDHLAIDSDPKPKTHKKSSSNTSNETQKTIIRAKKYIIKVDAPWLFSYRSVDDHVKDGTNIQLNLDIELDPYKLLDEGGTFPAQVSDKDKNEDGIKDNLSDVKSPEDSSTRGTTDPSDGDSDGSQDMEFSSSSSGTESDMEFSSEEEDVGETREDTEGKKYENNETKEEDDLAEALERLKINLFKTGPEKSVRDFTTPVHVHSEGSSSSSSELPGSPKLSESLNVCKEEEKSDVKRKPTTEDELEDMEFSSSDESVVEDHGEKDMEFSSDEDKKQSDTRNKVTKDRVTQSRAQTTTSPRKSKERHNREEDGPKRCLEHPKIHSSMPVSSHCKLLRLSKASKSVKKEKSNAELTVKEEDGVKDMEFSSSGESVAEDGGETDMEFSDEDKETERRLEPSGEGRSIDKMPLPKSKAEYTKDVPTPSSKVLI